MKVEAALTSCLSVFTTVFVPVERIGCYCVLFMMLLCIYDVFFLVTVNVYLVFNLYDKKRTINYVPMYVFVYNPLFWQQMSL